MTSVFQLFATAESMTTTQRVSSYMPISCSFRTVGL